MSKSDLLENKRVFLEKNGFYLSTPQGNSMFPFIVGQKDSIVLLPVRRELCKFDVILYERADGDHVLHRIIGKEERCYIVRGDNCFYKERVFPEQIIGVLAKVYKNGKNEKDVSKNSYRFSVVLWNLVYPFRFLVHTGMRVLRRLKRFLTGKK